MTVQAQIGKYIIVDYVLNLMDGVINHQFIVQAVQISEIQHLLMLGHIIHIKNQLFNIILLY